MANEFVIIVELSQYSGVCWKFECEWSLLGFHTNICFIIAVECNLLAIVWIVSILLFF